MYGEDPSVNRLQEVAAEMTGMEAALFVSSGTMGNLASVLAHCERRGQEVHVCFCQQDLRLAFVHNGQLSRGYHLRADSVWYEMQVIIGDESHVYNYEAGGMSVLGGIAFHVLPNQPNGELPLDLLARAVR